MKRSRRRGAKPTSKEEQEERGQIHEQRGAGGEGAKPMSKEEQEESGPNPRAQLSASPVSPDRLIWAGGVLDKFILKFT